MDKSYEDNLLRHFRGEDDSFLITIRCDLNWNHEFFINMISSMIKCCEVSKDGELLGREIASGFWYASWFIKEWSEHPNFRSKNNLGEEYYVRCYELLSDLAYYYFVGDSLTGDQLPIAEIDKELRELKQ